jgi:site-specific DNA-methyltransferase (cytosine-N4-specific)
LIWHKPACMPSSAKDRWTVDFEPIYFFTKGPKYKFNQQLENASTPLSGASWAERKDSGEPMRHGLESAAACGAGGFLTGEQRNARTVRKVNFEPSGDEHYASYPTKLVEPLILAGSDEGDVVLDIFAGTGTTLLTALRNRRRALGIELNADYCGIMERRLREIQVKLF